MYLYSFSNNILKLPFLNQDVWKVWGFFSLYLKAKIMLLKLFGFRMPFILLKLLWTPKSFCLYEFQILTVLEVNTETTFRILVYYITIKKLLHVNINNTLKENNFSKTGHLVKALFYIVANLFSVWPNKRQLDFQICFCIHSVCYITCHVPMENYTLKTH